MQELGREGGLQIPGAGTKEVLSAADNAILLVRKGTREISYANPSSGILLGVPHESLLGKPFEEVLQFARRDRDRGCETSGFEVIRDDGTTVSVMMKVVPYHWKEQEYEFVALTDMTEQLELERQLLLANESLKRWVVEAEQRNGELSVLQELTVLLQRSRDLEEVSKVASSVMPKILPKSLGDLLLMSSEKKDARTTSSWGGISADPVPLDAMRCSGLRTGATSVIRSEDPGSPFCARHIGTRFSTSFCIPLIIDGEVIGMLHVHFDKAYSQSQDMLEDSSLVHERKLGESAASLLSLALASVKLRETLFNQSTRDPLTGLYNRRYLEESIEREMARASRTKKPLGIIMADIDHFKVFNDRFGHAAGDQVIKIVSGCLRDHVRGNDIVCRFGGEEFLVVLQDATLADAANRAEHIREAVSSLVLEFEGSSLGCVTMSFGVSEFPIHGERPEQFIKEADMALYRAKKEGRNRVLTASPGVAPVG